MTMLSGRHRGANHGQLTKSDSQANGREIRPGPEGRKRNRAPGGQAAPSEAFAKRTAVRSGMVPLARLELALPKKTDFESVASTNSATGAL